ncbi:hypothetical protein F5B22DRAFT_466757 [Xylaria bambusicola]|uniref:uncharacterized protein n=1 Tax=Xylaria bambusicola TaxID=326684 RepID=UPI002007369A|nr:uncharacterized protein F5B22DRAFT_466757 [Xylaria bambusicola]KAI0522247.1 hypothetical protein F5B22DRAFT_466757 [Xylaria bambusicola]
MVSFFGLKIGGERKKKSSKDLQISGPQPQHPDDPNAIDNFLDLKFGPNPAYEASVYSLSRQESRQSSSSSIKSKFKGLRVAPFASNKFGSSMTDLPAPPSLRHHTSNPSLGRRWNTGSSTSLSFVPPSFSSIARPSTSDGKRRAQINKLDVQLTQTPSKGGFKGPLSPALTVPDDGPSTPSSATPKSPLGKYELKLDLPSDVSSFADFGNFSGTVETPAPLRIKKQASTRVLARPQARGHIPQKPPSPPQSVDGRDIPATPVLNSPKLPVAETQPPSSQSQRSIPSGLEDLQNVISNLEPASLPSPSTTPRPSEEKQSITVNPPRPTSSITKRGTSKPVIQNVRAKRDTLTINPQRRRSLEMKIEAIENGTIPPVSHADRPKTSMGGRLIERPPPLTLTTGFRPSDGPRSAPFLQNPIRSLTPTNMRSPLRLEVGATERHDWRASVTETRDQRSGIDSPTGSSVYDDDDDDVYEHPPSPESTSPVMPLTGPLASPCFPPSAQSPFSYSSISTSPHKDEIDSDRSSSPVTPPVPPRSSRRKLPTANSSYWPLPSPIAPSPDRAAVSPAFMDSRLRSESGSETGSFSPYEPLEPPRIPSVRSGAESPTFRSFSRPWTPSMASEFATPVLRRAETAGQLLGAGAAMGTEFEGGLRPPPRSATTRMANTDLRSVSHSTGPGGDDSLSGGFI